MNKNKNETSLCQSCFRIGCDWHDHFKPVDGWVATPTVILEQRSGNDKEEVSSYMVHRCPLYKDRGRGIIPITKKQLEYITKIYDLRNAKNFETCIKRMRRIGYDIIKQEDYDNAKRKRYYLVPLEENNNG